MPDHLVISGVAPFDGAYPLDIDEAPLTTLEWRWIKQLSGYLPMTITEGLAGGDPDLIVALAVIAMRRAGRITREQVLMTADQLADVPFDDAHLSYRLGDAEQNGGDASPPIDGAGSSSVDSGADSTPPSASPGNGPSPTGSRDSARSAAYDRLTSPT